MIFTNDRECELDNQLLWASTENRKQIEVCELAELTFLLKSFTSTAVRLDCGHS